MSHGYDCPTCGKYVRDGEGKGGYCSESCKNIDEAQGSIGARIDDLEEKLENEYVSKKHLTEVLRRLRGARQMEMTGKLDSIGMAFHLLLVELEKPFHCDECDPSFACFDGSKPCSKRPA
ncbi:MAG TPA: hypothetical protein VFA98_13265 [Thermoanaerobaculia bacterium]|nr:hypothetical protein [Thermoanaerobaculia bacterium]